LKIGELSRVTGVSTRSLRYYEEQNLLTADRTSGGTRQFDADAPERVRLIQELFAAGLSSAKILPLLPEVHSPTTTPDGIAQLVEERDEVDRQARELIEERDRLDDLIVAKQLRLRIAESSEAA
jgi:DNA-binding transcriptional MerR regulator